MLGDTATEAMRTCCSASWRPAEGLERLAAEIRAAGHMNPWIGPESVVPRFVDLAD